MTDEVDSFLSHYGVKGMKWGVRRKSSDSSSSNSSGSSDTAETSPKPKRTINKKHAAIAAGVIGGAAAVTLAAVVASNQKKAGQAAVAAQMQAFAKKSVWELAASNPQPVQKKTPVKKSAYSKRQRKADTKMYGAKGADRIQKRVDKGQSLSSARQKEVIRKHGGTALKIAYNVGSAKAKENAKAKFKK